MIVVEVLGRRGEVVQRLRLDRLPATIGRAWTNDVVIADPTVDPAHARIVADDAGALSIEDLGSLNGLHAGAARARVPSIALNGVTTVRIGRTGLRLARADQPVPPAIPDLAPAGRLAALLASPRAMAAVIAAGLALMVLNIWLDSYDVKTTSGIPGQTLGLVAVIALWAGTWAVIGRIRAHQFNFWQHVTLVLLAIMALDLLDAVRAGADFLFPRQGTLAGTASLAEAVVVIALITAQLALVTAAQLGRRIAIALAITAAVTVITLVSAKAAKDVIDASTVSIATELEPLPASVIPAESVEEFVVRMDGLKRQVDAKTKE